MLVTIVGDRGSAPRASGARMLVNAGGRLSGTVGGGAVEFAAEKQALDLLAARQSCLKPYRLHPNQVEDLGMICGGDVLVYFQYISGADAAWRELTESALGLFRRNIDSWLVLDLSDEQSPRSGIYVSERERYGQLPEAAVLAQLLCERTKQLSVGGATYFAEPLTQSGRVIIFGGGHIAQELAPLLHRVGFYVAVFEQRAEYITPQLFPAAEKLICGDYTRIADSIAIKANDFVVIMTNGHSHDYTVQEQVIRGDYAYLGVIGSRAKTAAINKKLRAAGVSEERIAAVYTPIGLAIRAETPAEIAVSITAELIRVRAERRHDGEVPASCPMHIHT